ncbi:MAG: nucleotidyltransferase domain-containing protein [Deltaproteobacteria bacterium]|jgi:predicted nucleotidyltransferase|nr:nucleotidyltransferase domain-containing protein [Deltaproteobacteria bacterium]
MALNLETVIATVKSYANDVRQNMPVEKVVLYGSYATGLARDDSDVDVCFFIPDFGDKDRHEIIVMMLKLAFKYDLYIEPVAFEVSDLYDDNPFVKEVLRTGIEIF